MNACFVTYCVPNATLFLTCARAPAHFRICAIQTPILEVSPGLCCGPQHEPSRIVSQHASVAPPTTIVIVTAVIAIPARRIAIAFAAWGRLTVARALATWRRRVATRGRAGIPAARRPRISGAHCRVKRIRVKAETQATLQTESELSRARRQLVTWPDKLLTGAAAAHRGRASRWGFFASVERIPRRSRAPGIRGGPCHPWHLAHRHSCRTRRKQMASAAC